MHTFWTTAELLAQHLHRRDIDARVDAGLLVPVRRGLWTTPDAPVEIVRAARTGGAATATTAAAALELWTPPDDRLQIAVLHGASRLRDPDDATLLLGDDPGVQVTWTSRMPPVRTLPDRIAPVLLVLEHAIRTLRPEFAVAIIDSALHTRLIRPADVAALALALPAHLRGLLRFADGRADSGLESIVRYPLVLAGLLVQVHPVLDGIGEVDLLVAGRLIIETDGKLFHLGEQFAVDRRRDRAAALARYRVLRLTYFQVVHDWPATFAAIRALVADAA